MGFLEKNKSEKFGEPEISLIFPAYNEADRIEDAVEKTIKTLQKIASSYEIIIAEDGSTDGTAEIASRLSKTYTSVKHLHSDKRLGRGRSLARAFKSSRGKIIAYMDVDLSTSLKHLEDLISAVRDEGYDFAIGSRLLPESKVERTTSRTLASRAYNFLVRILLGTNIRDHQCGFKSFNRNSLLKVIDEVKASHWFWDTELLVKALRKGYRVKEIPVEWRGDKKTKVRLFRDSLIMGIQVLKLWLELNSPFSAAREP